MFLFIGGHNTTQTFQFLAAYRDFCPFSSLFHSLVDSGLLSLARCSLDWILCERESWIKPFLCRAHRPFARGGREGQKRKQGLQRGERGREIHRGTRDASNPTNRPPWSSISKRFLSQIWYQILATCFRDPIIQNCIEAFEDKIGNSDIRTHAECTQWN